VAGIPTTAATEARGNDTRRSTMFKTLEDQRKAIEAAALENAKRETVAAVYQRFPLLVRCMGNDKQIIAIIDRWAENPDLLPSIQLFEAAIEENPQEFASLAQQPEAKTRQQLLEQIIELLAAKGKGHDAFTLNQEEKRLALLAIPALRARLADLQTKAHMASTPVPILKAIVADTHRNQSIDGYPALPSSLWDGSRHVRCDADYLNGLAKTDIWMFKKLVRLYGSAQIDRARGIK
jgi:hypothetical protein